MQQITISVLSTKKRGVIEIPIGQREEKNKRPAALGTVGNEHVEEKKLQLLERQKRYKRPPATISTPRVPAT
jgi:hypothetical protein